MTRIVDLASQIRSKNAGPTRLTLDLFFSDLETYERVRDADALEPAAIANLYGVPESAIHGIYAIERIRAIKITIARPVTAGDSLDSDVYGTQQHVPLLDLEV